MSRLKKLIETLSSVKSTWIALFRASSGGEQELLQQPYRKSDLVYICISTTAKAISQVPLRVYRVWDEGREPVEKDHPWQKLFRRPNYLMDQYSFIEAIVSYLMLDGHVWVIPYPPGIVRSGGVPDSLWVVSKRNMEPVRSPTGHLLGWRYRPNPVSGVRESIELGVDEVVSIWFWNPYDPVMGLSPLEAGYMSIMTDYKAAYYNAVFFDEGAMPGGVLYTEQSLSDHQFQRLKEQIEARHKGYTKGHRLMILERGLKYQQVAISHKDMEFYDLRRFNQERILQIFGMKKVIISVTDDLNYATAREQRKEWWQGTCIPIMRLIQSALNFSLFRDSDLEVEFDLTTVEALQEDLKDKVDTALKLSKLGFTANEINERLNLGFEPKPWRDYWYAPVNVLPIGGEEDEEDEEEDEEGGGKQLKEADLEKLYEGYWKSFIRGVRVLEDELERDVKKLFREMKNKALKLLFRGERKGVEDLTGEDWREEKEKIKKLAGAIYAQAMKKGAESIGRELGIGVRFDLTDPEAVSFLAKKLLQVTGVIDTIKRQLARTLAEGMEQGESIDELAERVERVFEVAEHRARTIARTEVIGAANYGRHQQIMKTDYTEVRWFTALDERVRPTHRAMHGKTKKKDEMWVVGGASLRFPGDPAGPAREVINCRCIEVVVPESLRLIPSTDPKQEFLKKKEKLIRKYASKPRAYGKTALQRAKNFMRELRKLVDDYGGIDQLDMELLMNLKKEEAEELLKKVIPSRHPGVKRVREYLARFAGRFFSREVLERVARSKLEVELKGEDFRSYYLRSGWDEGKIAVRSMEWGRGDRLVPSNTFAHEFGHHVEHSLLGPGAGKGGCHIRDVLKEWLLSRARKDKRGQPVIKSLKELTGLPYDDDELAVVEGFIDVYVGRVYPNFVSSEVVSMGLPEFLEPERLRAFMKEDWEHFSIVYGIITGALS